MLKSTHTNGSGSTNATSLDLRDGEIVPTPAEVLSIINRIEIVRMADDMPLVVIGQGATQRIIYADESIFEK